VAVAEGVVVWSRGWPRTLGPRQCGGSRRRAQDSGRRWRHAHQAAGRSRSAGKRAHQIGSKIRLRTESGRDEAPAAVRRVIGELVELAETAAADRNGCWPTLGGRRAGARVKAAHLRACGGHDPAAGRRRGQLARAVNDLTELLDAAWLGVIRSDGGMSERS
jgi:IS5 family transposase